MSGRRMLAGVEFAQSRQLRRGAFLAEAGAPADTLYLLARGRVRVFLLAEDGRETTTAILGPGQIVGIAPLLGQPTYHAFAQTLTPVGVWAFPAKALLDQLPGDAPLLGLVLGALAQRFVLAEGLFRDLAVLPTFERVCDIEARLAACAHGDVPRLSRVALAALINVRPETLSRILSRDRALAGAARGEQSAATEGLVRPAAVQTFTAGEVVLEADLPAGHVGMVVAGQVRLTLRGASRRQVDLDALGPGEIFGLTALLGLPPLGQRVEALTDGALQIIDDRTFLEHLRSDPAFHAQLVAQLSNRVQRLERRLAGATMTHARERLLTLLSELSQWASDGAPPRRTWSHAALARQLGTTRETITRTLAKLEAAGAIRRERRHIILAHRPGMGSQSRLR